MNEIKDSIYSTVINDATFISLTGSTASDRRLYFFFPPKQVNESLPWVTYNFSSGGIDADEIGCQQIPDRILNLDIFATNARLISDIFTRFIELFDKQELNTTSYRIMIIRYQADNDLVERKDNLSTLYHKNITFNMSTVLEKTI